MCLPVAADRAAGKHLDDSRNRGKAGLSSDPARGRDHRRRHGSRDWRTGGLRVRAGREPALMFSRVRRAARIQRGGGAEISRHGASTGPCFRGGQGARLLPHDALPTEVADGYGFGEERVRSIGGVVTCFRTPSGFGKSDGADVLPVAGALGLFCGVAVGSLFAADEVGVGVAGVGELERQGL